MIMNDDKFVYVTYVATTAQKVWKALTEGELARQYWRHEIVSDLKTGSAWALVADDGKRTKHAVGKVLECVPNKRLVLTWGDDGDTTDPNQQSRAAIDIETVGDAVRLTVTHDQLSADMRRRITSGWPRVLSSLKSLLETGRALDTACT